MGQTLGMAPDPRLGEAALGGDARHGEWAERASGELFRVVTILDGAGRVQYTGPTMASFLGVDPEALFGRSVFDAIHPDDRRRAWACLIDVIAAGGASAPIELQVRRHDGEYRTLQVVAASRVDGSEGSGVVVMTYGVEERVLTEQSLDATGEQYRLLVEHSPDAITVLSDGRVVYSNAAGMVLLRGTDEGEVLDRNFLDLVHPESRAIVEECITAALADDAPRALADVQLVRLDGTTVHAEGAVVSTPHEGRPGLQLVLRDITERRRTEADLEHRAFHDPLTGLANRGLLIDRVAQACARAQRTGSLVGMLFTDVDDFKEVNDKYGHQAGDAVLRAIAERLRGALRPSDTVARYGGDEFVVVCEDVSEPAMMPQIVQRVERCLTAPFRIADEDVRVTVSVGAVAERSPAGDELIERADQAMYAAKIRRKQGS